MKRALSFLLFSLLSFSLFAGGGWINEKGHGFAMLSQRYIGGSFYAFNNASIYTTPLAGVYTTNLYAEYALTNKVEISTFFPFLTGAFMQAGTDELGAVYPEDAAFGLGDMDVAIKYGLLSGGLNLAVSGLFGLPLGDNQAGETNRLMLGDGEFNQMIKLDASVGLGAKWYGTFMVGFNHRTQGFSEEFHSSLEIGRNGDKLLALTKFYLLKSMNNGNANVASLPGIYSNNLEYFALNPSFLYKMGNGGINLDLGFALHLRNIIAAPSLSLGYFLKF
ncbi:MAG: hypothetical protein KDC92_04850 [Bacteroidetes bacterium]|nr:hypothetical protein [Bacteroidota bacterium]